MSTITDIEICSNALIRLGAQPIQSFDEETDIATSCSVIYPIKANYILSSFPWNFTKKYAQLAQLSDPPSAQWSYAYTLPVDRVSYGLSAVFTSNKVGALPVQNYTIIGNELMTNLSPIIVEYQYRALEYSWPSYFVELMINVLMVELCILITDNSEMKQQLTTATYGMPSEVGVGGLYGRTMSLDSRDNPTIEVLDDSLLEARFGGGAL